MTEPKDDPIDFISGTHHYYLDDSCLAAAIFYNWYECKICGHRELWTYDERIKAFTGMPFANNIIQPAKPTCNEIIMQDVLE